LYLNFCFRGFLIIRLNEPGVPGKGFGGATWGWVQEHILAIISRGREYFSPHGKECEEPGDERGSMCGRETVSSIDAHMVNARQYGGKSHNARDQCQWQKPLGGGISCSNKHTQISCTPQCLPSSFFTDSKVSLHFFWRCRPDFIKGRLLDCSRILAQYGTVTAYIELT
jgi:hypothetical protein